MSEGRRDGEGEVEAGGVGGGGGEEEEEAGGPWLEVVEEEAELRESQVWKAVAEEELRRGPWTEEGEEEEEGLLSHPWTAAAAEQSSGGGPGEEEEEEGLRYDKEVVEVPASSVHSSRLPLLPSSQ